MITDFFTDPGTYAMESLWFADQVLFIDRKGIHSEPPSVRGKVKYLGPVARRFEYTRRGRLRARQELGLALDAAVVSVFPGSWTRAAAPILDAVLAAFDALRARTKHLIWLAGADVELIRRRTKGHGDVLVIGTDWKIDRLMAASDLAITKGSRTTIRELAA